jgi:hypothetical protein
MLMLTRDQAEAAVQAATAERDTVQANLLDLDGSFGKRLLAGATLTGETQQRWAEAEAELIALWDTFRTYSDVVDQAAALLAGAGRRPQPAQLTQITTLLSGPSIRLTRPEAPLARRELTGSTGVQLSIADAVAQMRGTFSRVVTVVTAAEAVWNEAADRLRLADDELRGARERAAGITDDALRQALATAGDDLTRLRGVLNANPLALWIGGQVDRAPLDRLRDHVTAAAQAAGRLATLRDGADRRIATATAAVAAARTAREDALAARERAAAKIVTGVLPALPHPDGLDQRLAGLDPLRAAGRWTRLDAELDIIEKQAAAAAQASRDAQRAAVALLERRDELRGLLDAYRARAARMGAIEDADLEAAARRATGLLWSAPCDLTQAAAAVTGYQQAVLALSRRESRS